MYLASLVNLGMIWCFGFFFLESLDGFDEETNNDAIASRCSETGQHSDTPPMICAAGSNDVAILFLHSSS